MKNLIKLSLSASILIASLQAKPVEIATDNLGDFLIAPFYIAKGNICSEIKVLTDEKCED
jgi:hypothetical protein